MIDTHAFLLFLGGALLLNVTPGPDMAFTAATAARGGRRAGIAAALGVGAGAMGWAVATALGLAAMLAASEHALTILRLIGGAYLLFLAVRTITETEPSAAEAPARSGAGNTAGVGVVRFFRAGALTNLFNPKVGLFYLAFLPTFVDPARPVAMQMLLLGAVFGLTGAGVLVLVALGVGSARTRLGASIRFRERLKIVSAAVYGGLGVYLLVSGARR